MQDNRLIAFNVFVIATALIIAIFMMGGCLERTAISDNQVKIACFQQGGTWSLVPGKTDTYYCARK